MPRARLLYATLTPQLQFHATWGPVNDRPGLWLSGGRPMTAPQPLALQVTCTGAALDRKLVALRAHASQTASLLDHLGEEDFRR